MSKLRHSEAEVLVQGVTWRGQSPNHYTDVLCKQHIQTWANTSVKGTGEELGPQSSHQSRCSRFVPPHIQPPVLPFCSRNRTPSVGVCSITRATCSENRSPALLTLQQACSEGPLQLLVCRPMWHSAAWGIMWNSSPRLKSVGYLKVRIRCQTSKDLEKMSD